MKKFDYQQAMTDMLKVCDLLSISKKAIADLWQNDGIICAKKYVSTGYIEVGYEKFKYGRIDMFAHIKIPKTVDSISQVQSLLTSIVGAFPKVSVYYNDNMTKDYNKGFVYNPVTNKVLKEFNTKGFAYLLEEELAILDGTKKYKPFSDRVNYDMVYENMSEPNTVYIKKPKLKRRSKNESAK